MIYKPIKILDPAQVITEAASPYTLRRGVVNLYSPGTGNLILNMPSTAEPNEWVAIKNIANASNTRHNSVKIQPQVGQQVEVPFFGETDTDLLTGDPFDLAKYKLYVCWIYTDIGWLVMDEYAGPRNPMNWRGQWQPGTYHRGDTVFDNGWTMIANKTTTERAAPQPQGEPYWASGLGDTPTWDSVVVSNNQLLSGHRYVPDIDAGYILAYRVWIPDLNPLIDYVVWLVRDPLGIPVITKVWDEVPGSTGWLSLAIENHLIFRDETFDLLLAATSVDGFSSWAATWDYKRSGGNPSEGEIRHQGGAQTEMRINYTDKDPGGPVDRTAELTALAPGDTVAGAGVTWEILNNDPQIDHTRLTVTPAARGTEGETAFTFETYAPTNITYVRIVNQNAGNAAIRGLYSESGYNPSITPDDNAYGVDIRIQQAYVSPDWDLVSG